MTRTVGLALGLVFGLAAVARAAGGLLVVAPHPDDEVLAAGGVVSTALAAGREVYVAVVTNGDYFGTDYGLARESESVAALGVLGLPEDHVAFLGYPDSALLNVWNDAPGPSDAFLSPRSGRRATYGNRGYGKSDFHTALTGVPGPYDRPTLVGDMRSVLELFRPAEILVTGAFDQHPDHRGSFYAVRDAARALALDDATFRPLVDTTIVHDPIGYPFDDFWPLGASRSGAPSGGDDDVWPNPSASSGVPRRFDPTVPFVMPPSLPKTILDWAVRVSRQVPAAMRVANFDQNLKTQSLSRYQSQASDVLWAHAKSDEFFWSDVERVGQYSANVARGATATASSAAAGQGAGGAIDGVVDGAPGDPGAEWAAAAPGAGPSLRLTWASPVVLDRVVLHDRVGLADHVTAGRLAFDDQSVVRVGTLANDGRGDEIVFDAVHRTQSLTFTVDGAVGTPGLAELEAFGAATCNVVGDCPSAGACGTAACRGGVCVTDPAPDGTACGDGNACNGVEICRAGSCTRNPAPDCADGDPCTTDTCQAPGTCVHTPSCNPVPARGRGGCRLGFVGLPAGVCEDGDPRCDTDQTNDGACSFEVILCADPTTANAHCDVRVPLARLAVRGRAPDGLGELAGLLAPRMPVAAPTCVGPVAVHVALKGALRRSITRQRVPFMLTLADGRKLRAVVKLGCRPAPAGARRRPPAPLTP